MQQLIAILLVTLLAGVPLLAQGGTAIQTDWTGFQRQVRERRLLGRIAEIQGVRGQRYRTAVKEVTETHLVVKSNRNLQAWETAKGVARIPKEEIAGVRFLGRMGHGGLAGALAGAGAGAAISAATLSGTDVTEGPFVIILPIIGAAIAGGCTLVGYLIGRSAAPAAPEFVLR